MDSRIARIWILVLLWGCINTHFGSYAAVVEDDVRCVQRLKQLLNDPLRKLASRDFRDHTVGFICDFVSITCWNNRENQIFSLELQDMEITGEVPKDIEYCASLTKLDLGRNEIFEPIPPDIYNWLLFFVTLDLSGHDFSGVIPRDLQHYEYLNVLILSDNKLSGSIPYEFSSLGRLKTFSVANNKLKGSIPSFFDGFDKVDFAGNSGLCGGPLELKCGGLSKKSTGSRMVTAIGIGMGFH
ncbi:hypothetical protein ACFX13_013618 [Malus domestica]|uniref:inactive LRR receptor-like serine/threonine-protein kinase BIR2 n=1 Tax=Malus domestica TaxID=3750 RepID=UPI0010AA3DC0|nr:inactive LRR receptor-like serine/threonine-protein kinase BIR2 [Malus domestica]